MIEVHKKHTALFNCFKQLSKNAFNSSKEDQGEGGGREEESKKEDAEFLQEKIVYAKT